MNGNSFLVSVLHDFSSEPQVICPPPEFKPDLSSMFKGSDNPISTIFEGNTNFGTQWPKMGGYGDVNVILMWFYKLWFNISKQLKRTSTASLLLLGCVRIACCGFMATKSRLFNHKLVV